MVRLPTVIKTASSFPLCFRRWPPRVAHSRVRGYVRRAPLFPPILAAIAHHFILFAGLAVLRLRGSTPFRHPVDYWIMSTAPHAGHAVDASYALDNSSNEWSAQNLPCTKGDGASCKLLEHHPEINRVLLGAALQLREDKRGQRRGDVLIAAVEASTCRSASYSSVENSCKARALDLVELLLAEHRCITAIEFNSNLMLRPSLISVVKRHRHLNSFTVCGRFIASDRAAVVFDVIRSLPQLKNLAFKSHEFEKDSLTMSCIIDYSFDLRISCLSTLDLAELRIPSTEAGRLVQALIENESITDLCVGESVFSYRDKDSYRRFTSYLANENCPLRKLTLKSNAYFISGSLMGQLVDAFCKMNFLKELNVDIVDIATTIFVPTFALFAEVATRSAKLRSLRLPWRFTHSHLRVHNASPEATQCMKSWQTALQGSKSPLKQLRVDLTGFGEAECDTFFDAIANNESLRLVEVDTLPFIDGLDRVSKTILERGLNDRVVIKGHHRHSNAINLLKCPQISTVAVTLGWFISRPRVGPQSLISTLEVVGSSSNVTSLLVEDNRFNRDELSALAACLRNAAVLTDADINLRGALAVLSEKDRTDVRAELVSALASNHKLVKVSIKGVLLSNDDLNVLAQFASKSLSLTEFTMTPVCCGGTMPGKLCEELQIFFEQRPAVLKEAFNFKNIALADILQATIRNASSVSAASQFVLGQQNTLDGADAIELMHDHPRLLEMVMEGADLTKNKAKEKISSALLRVHHCSLEEFMRIAGVVKERVECLRHPDARFQLVDINEHCWLHIRRFLKIRDVVNIEPVSVDQNDAWAFECD
ncbi:uncharacterized protein [Dermacentor albipictus]|uniref:uncharacterized protein n=1 Tax=Dermacentor albipictus TaxID=60249 RepID=UPI0031FD8785